MSLREKIENNLAIWMFGALGAGFLAGIGTYKSIMDIAQLDVIPKSRLEELEGGCKPKTEAIEPINEVSKPTDSPDSEKLQAQSSPSVSKTSQSPEERGLEERNTASRESSSDFLQELFGTAESEKSEPLEMRESEKSEPLEMREAEKPEALEMRFSEGLVPFPEHFDLIRPGMRLSEARIAFPDGKIFSRWYAVDIEGGPFSNVSYHMPRGEDPPIEVIHFYFRSDEAKKLVVSETLRKFGGISHSSESLGAVLSWPDINGFALTLSDSSYRISLRGEE